METKLEYWHRQTLRDGAARILADWKEDNATLEQQLAATKAKLDVAVDELKTLKLMVGYRLNDRIDVALKIIEGE